ncbi:hypothetical protein Hte_006952 [Hypoxylon texense]
MYDDLNTNIPHTLMKYSDSAFKDGCEIFPTRQDVQEYLVRYARDVRHLVKFSTQVTNITLRQDQQQRDQWGVRTKDLLTGQETQETYDAVVVASGHYSTPYIPDSIENISEFNAAYPGLISHSKLYRNAETYRGKKVVIVGNGPSGLDITRQIQRVSQRLLLSVRTKTPPEMLEHIGKVEEIGQIKRFLLEDRAIEFYSDTSDNSGTIIEKDIDAVLFCTGYLYTFPFLSLSPPLVTDGRKVRGLAKHFLHVAHPTLAFPGLPIKVIPFPLAESQAAVFSRLWSGRLPLPSRETLEAWERADEEAATPGKYHVFPKGADGRYINEIRGWVTRDTRKPPDGDGSGSVGKEPPYWDAEMLWERSIYAEAKMQFEKTGRKAKTLEELGFRYEPTEKEVTAPEDVEKTDPHLDVAG